MILSSSSTTKGLFDVLTGGEPLSYFNRIYLFLFLPLVVLIYNLTPKRFRPVILIIASFICFFMMSNKLIVFLILSILSIYLSGRLMNKVDDKTEKALKKCKKTEKKVVKEKYKKKKKIILVLTILINVAFLFYFKYLNFFAGNANIILKWLNIKYSFQILHHLAPIGISFYTLEALSYIIDVYNSKIKAETNLLKVTLFLSFFPQIMEGPIARYSDTAESLYSGIKVTYKSFCFGYQRILYGLFKKLVIANRLNILVKIIFNEYMNYSGLSVALGVIGYTIMLYMEFSGTMDIVLGSGEMFGVKIPENFRQPFFSKNISEFWTRWHISLGLWFKDYIFYPVSLSKPMKNLTVKARKKLGNHFGPLISGTVALFTVWFLNGLWHGAGWTYLFFGMYHFFMILMGNIFEPLIIKICQKLHIDRKKKFYRVFQSVKMTILVFIGELFFRAPTMKNAFEMLSRIFTKISFKTVKNGELLSLGLDIHDYIVLILAIIFIFVIGLLKEKGKNIREDISNKDIFTRWILYYALIVIIIVFGAYGIGYEPVEPIYADF